MSFATLSLPTDPTTGHPLLTVVPGPRADDLILRDYQREAVKAALAHLQDRRHVHVIELPTGSGKTRIACALISRVLDAGHTVLFVANRWHLLQQAADELRTLLPEHVNSIRRIGGSQSCLRDLPSGAGGRIHLTTLQTWQRREQTLPKAVRASRKLVVIWDEVHWGVHSRLGRALRSRYRGRSPIFGLSATPLLGRGIQVIHSTPPDRLWGTVLASPLVREIPTGVCWAPAIVDNDYAPASLRDLAEDDERNRQIAEELIAGRRDGRYRRTLVFACNIEHAIRLVELFGTFGVAARVLHSRLPPRDQEKIIDQFKRGQVSVLVNVAMLTVGYDDPAIDSVFLVRPTRSPRLLKQMIGRGARKAPGKDSFSVVEFTDNLQRLQDAPAHAWRIVSATSRPRGAKAPMAPQQHEEPRDAPRFENFAIPGYGEIPIALGQTFGAEIELTAPIGVPHKNAEWTRTANEILDRLADAAEYPVHHKPLSYAERLARKWHVKYDNTAGWEVVSPILRDAEGFWELQRVCRALNRLLAEKPDRLKVNHRTGLHITLATRLNDNKRIRGFVRRVQRLEPGLFTLVAPSRLYPWLRYLGRYSTREGNWYCRPLRKLGSADRLQMTEFMRDHDNRYYTVNLTRARDDIQLLEVRMHSGTCKFQRIALWLSLWMQIFNRSRYEWPGLGRCGTVFARKSEYLHAKQIRREDIIALLDAEGIPLAPDFQRMLRDRRRELRHCWEEIIPLRVACWSAAGWYD